MFCVHFTVAVIKVTVHVHTLDLMISRDGIVLMIYYDVNSTEGMMVLAF